MIEEINIKAVALTAMDKKLQEKFAEDIARQSTLMDDISKQLITIELAVPSLYATALKLVSGGDATLRGGAFLWVSFGLWFAALAFAFLAIFPKKYVVDKNSLTQIERFYHSSAKRKGVLLAVSVFCFFAGVATSVCTLF